MSWSISVVGRNAADAKQKLAEANEKTGGNLPPAVAKLAEAAIDALPECGVEGYEAIAVSSYGHFRPEGADPQSSNVNLSVQHVNSDGLPAGPL